MDVLITVGKGQFQNKIIERFMKHKGHDHNLTRICSTGGIFVTATNTPTHAKLEATKISCLLF